MGVKVSKANRGQGFEQLLNLVNQQYKSANIALIDKLPTPIKATKTKGCRVLSGYFEEKSTVDYYGTYKGRSIYFEAKTTTSQTRFDLDNIHKHQINYLEIAEKNGAICFFLIEFSAKRQAFFVPLSFVRHYILHASTGGRKSIPFDEFEVYAYEVQQTKRAALDYLLHVDKMIGEGAA